MAPDLYSGWGIRTLSRAHPSYNPYAYHLGTVWPVENAAMALGMKRYGFDAEAETLFSGMLDAASHFELSRLPETLGGHGRDEVPVPTVYPRSNSPQAWSASAMVQLVQTQLGLYPFAPARLLALVRPRLPSWLPELVLRRLRVGEAVVTLRFVRRRGGRTDWEVLERDGPLRVVAVPPPNAADGPASLRERLFRLLVEHTPSRLLRLLRIAIGRY
jgi:glycogen debranching enzyme